MNHVLLAVMLAVSFSVIFGSQNAYAGNGCSVDPALLDLGTFGTDVLFPVSKTITCFEGVKGVIVSPSDCISKGILVDFVSAGINQLVYTAEEVISTNLPHGVEAHCS